MRAYIKRIIRNLSRLRLQTMNDWKPLGHYHLFNIIHLNIGKLYMADYTILASAMIFGYGYQLTIKGRL